MLIEVVMRQFEVLMCLWCVLFINILRWLFNRMLNSGSSFLISWIRKILHSIRYIKSLLLQLLSWKIWYIFCATLLSKDCEWKLAYSISFPILRSTWWKTQLFFFLERICSFPSIKFLPSSGSWRFLFLLKAKIGGSWNTSLNFWFIWSKLQLLVIALFTLGNVQLHVNTSGILLLWCFFLFSLQGAFFCPKS